MASSAENLARRLAHTDKSVRDEAFAAVSKWLVAHVNSQISSPSSNSSSSELEMMKMWKALFYCIWMSDKPAVQNELVTKTAELLQKLVPNRHVTASMKDSGSSSGSKNAKSTSSTSSTSSSSSSSSSSQEETAKAQMSSAILFVSSCFKTLHREWAGLDRYRLDKYLLLLRRLVHEIFAYIQACSWDQETVVQGLIGDGSTTNINSDDIDQTEKKDKKSGGALWNALATPPNGIRLHLVDVFTQEVYTAIPTVSTNQLLLLLSPFLEILRSSRDEILFQRVVDEVFRDGILSLVLTGGTNNRIEEILGTGEKNNDTENDEEEEVGRKGKDVRASLTTTTPLTAKALPNVNIAVLARTIFSIGADANTKHNHRDTLYALHKEFTIAAKRLGHAKKDADVYPPRPVVVASASVVTTTTTVSGSKKAPTTTTTKSSTSSKRKQPVEEDEDDEEDEDEEEEEVKANVGAGAGRQANAKKQQQHKGGNKEQNKKEKVKNKKVKH